MKLSDYHLIDRLIMVLIIGGNIGLWIAALVTIIIVIARHFRGL